MGGIFTGSKSQDMKKAQNNLHYIVSYYFTQERKPQNNKHPFIMCQQVQEDKRIKGLLLLQAWRHGLKRHNEDHLPEPQY